ncbi:MAG: exo-alpha-sialidase [Gammaproteobacteria bacterium]
MPPSCWIATRKGLIEAQPSGSGNWSLSPPHFPGEPVSMVLPDNGSGYMYAALNLGHFGPKLHRSSNHGETWEEVATPAFPEAPKDAQEAKSVAFIWILERGIDDCLWAGTVPAGLFRSTDEGASWEFIESLNASPGAEEWFGGGYDDPGIHSIAVDPRDQNKLTIAISCGGVWHSEDNGVSWANKSHGMRAAYLPPEMAGDLNTQDPHRMLACPADPDRLWVQHHNGIFRRDETDGHWQEIDAVDPSTFGFALAVHPEHPDTAWFVPAIKDESRMPVNCALVVTRTTDGGETFQKLASGLPQAHSYDLVYRHGLEVAGDGTTLIMGSTSGNVWASVNAGDHWQQIAGNLAPVYCIRFAQADS